MDGWKIQKTTVRRVLPRGQRERLDAEVANDLFGEAFGHVPVELE